MIWLVYATKVRFAKASIDRLCFYLRLYVDNYVRIEEHSVHEGTNTTATPSNLRSQAGTFTPTSRTVSAEYPFHANLCLQPSQSINFDLTHKRGGFLPLRTISIP